MTHSTCLIGLHYWLFFSSYFAFLAERCQIWASASDFWTPAWPRSALLHLASSVVEGHTPTNASFMRGNRSKRAKQSVGVLLSHTGPDALRSRVDDGYRQTPLPQCPHFSEIEKVCVASIFQFITERPATSVAVTWWGFLPRISEKWYNNFITSPNVLITVSPNKWHIS